MDPAFLLLPPAGAPVFPRLARKVQLLALRRLLTFPAGALPARATALGRAQAVLAAAARSHKAAVLHALGTPDVLAPLLVLQGDLRPPLPLVDEAVPNLLLALVRAGALPESLIWDAPISRLVDDGGDRVLRFEPPAEALLFAPDGVEARLADGTLVRLVGAGADAPLPEAVRAESALHPIAHGVRLATVDTNPLADIEAHPGKEGNAISLGGHGEPDWQAALQEAFALIEAGIPTWAEELPHALRRLIPVGYHDQQHLSASYREAPGLAYMTLHPNRVTLAEAIVHETQHGKLNTLLQLDPVLENGRTTWTPSPVRPDLRPLEGVLLAVHAFVPVAAMHKGLADAGHPLSDDPWFRRRRAEVLAGNARGMDILEDKGVWTAAGRRLRDDMRRLHDSLVAAAPPAPAPLPPGAMPG
jgi:HEXXH motif-containing protein